MCNACGFYCCAYDGFSKCGCDHCPEPKCWDEDPDDDPLNDDYYDCSKPKGRRFFCDSPAVLLQHSGGDK